VTNFGTRGRGAPLQNSSTVYDLPGRTGCVQAHLIKEIGEPLFIAHNK